MTQCRPNVNPAAQKALGALLACIIDVDVHPLAERLMTKAQQLFSYVFQRCKTFLLFPLRAGSSALLQIVEINLLMTHLQRVKCALQRLPVKRFERGVDHGQALRNGVSQKITGSKRTGKARLPHNRFIERVTFDGLTCRHAGQHIVQSILPFVVIGGGVRGILIAGIRVPFLVYRLRFTSIGLSESL